jgi:hypothetical protein
MVSLNFLNFSERESLEAGPAKSTTPENKTNKNISFRGCSALSIATLIKL